MADDPPPRKRICLGLNVPKPAPNAKQSASDRKENGKHVTLDRVAPRVDNYTVRHTPPPDQGCMEEKFHAMVREAWRSSPRMQTGVTTIELRDCGIKRIDRVLRQTAREMGCASLDHVFPLIKKDRCRTDLQGQLAPKARVVPVWMLIFVLARVGNKSQFHKYNDRFRTLFDLLEEIQEGTTDAASGILDNVPQLVRESIILAGRDADLVLRAYHDKAVRAVTVEVPVLDTEVHTLRGEVDAVRGEMEAMRRQLQTLLEASS